MMPIVCGLIPLLAGLALLIPGLPRVAPTGVLVSAALAVLGLAFGVVNGREPGTTEYLAGNYFLLDATSALFLMLISVVFAGISLYLLNRDEGGAGLLVDNNFAGKALLFFSCSVFAVLSNHLVSMWVFLELGTFAIAPLICLDGREASVRAAWKYLKFSVIGLAINFLGLLCLARAMGGAHGIHELSLFLDELGQVPSLGDSPWWQLGLALMVFGLGTKLGLAPMYAWQPDAYDEAPPAVTALLTAVQSNCVILAVFREVALFRSFDPKLVSYELILMGVASIIIAGLHIITADNFKRLIAYASINHAGTIALGLGGGKYAGYGVVLYVVSNALVKAVLFLSGGEIERNHGTKKITTLKGLIRVMPFSAWAFMLGVFALLGFAPFGSFLGELMMLSNMIEEGYLVEFILVCMMLTIVLMATGRALFPMIWGDAVEGGPTTAKESFWSVCSCLFFVVLLLSMGLYMPSPLSKLMQEVAATLGGR